MQHNAPTRGAVGTRSVVVSAGSVASATVAQRTSEIGVRIALGAQPQHIVWLIGRRTALQVIAGLGLGLAGALGVGRLLKASSCRPLPRTR